ncbi:hypothetical protein CR203_16405 [Salipaludibacillus neizhouensis]|uniref:DUF1811 domain-containing protein n=1 Tax=Salipaludibacillus neizhouensis TaxID=885475 RepID=A0A3A9K5K4_9BACI|nr:YfhH family protein [Salipaludibacillus neizhouensis]RKL66140.1 hypothetical protein CR203_16405 [Salipaludibacillus neizhouensis]
MEQKYSRMKPAELQIEIAELKIKAQKAEQMGMINEYAVHERKMIMAQAYLMDPANFIPGMVYEIKDGENETFHVDYMNGVFAWGFRNQSKTKEAVPISVLGNKKR